MEWNGIGDLRIAYSTKCTLKNEDKSVLFSASECIIASNCEWLESLIDVYVNRKKSKSMYLCETFDGFRSFMSAWTAKQNDKQQPNNERNKI